MPRRNQLNPMRFLVLLAVTWVAGTLLFAAEQTPRPTPAAAPAAATQAGDTASPALEGQANAQSPVTQTEAPTEPEEPLAEAQDGEEQEAEEPESSPVKQGENAQRASAADKGSPKRFVPSEQVRADFDVSFPIDI